MAVEQVTATPMDSLVSWEKLVVGVIEWRVTHASKGIIGTLGVTYLVAARLVIMLVVVLETVEAWDASHLLTLWVVTCSAR